MEQTPDTQCAVAEEKTAEVKTTFKKQWIKPESRVLNINSGGGTLPDGPDTRAPLPIS